jgi:hypothetical protein
MLEGSPQKFLLSAIMIIIIIIIIIIIKLQTSGINTCPSQCMKREMSQCCGIKQYTQTDKLQQIGQI